MLLLLLIGTPGYVAPEILKGEQYGKEVDMWSTGCILYILLSGYPPFYHQNHRILFEQIKAGDYSFADEYGWHMITDPAKELIGKMLTVDPAKRITPAEALAHPWIAGNVASTRNFGDDYGNRMKLLEARNKFRKAVKVIIALNRFTIDIPDEEEEAKR